MASGVSHGDDLNQFYKRKVEFPQQQLDDHIKTADREVRKLLADIREIQKPGVDPMIGSEIIPTGSAFEGLRVRGNMELDFMIPFFHPEFNFVPSSQGGIPGGYRQLKVQRRTQMQNPSSSTGSPSQTFESKFTSDGCLVSSKVYQWFQSLADKAMNNLRARVRFAVKFTGNEPARTLVITLNPGVEIEVDLVLAVCIEDGLHVVAKPLKTAPHLHLWRLSFSVFERKILNDLPTTSCHLKTLKIFKYLREHDNRLDQTSQFKSGICSYHLKTAFLHLLTSTHPLQWEDTPKNLEERLDSLIGLLIKSMEEQQLNHFFLGSKSSLARKAGVRSMKSEGVLNLFVEPFMNASTLNQARERLVIIRRSLPAILKQL